MRQVLFRGLILIFSLWMSQALAAEKAVKELKQYETIPLTALENPLVAEIKNDLKPGQVKVLEFFSYGCVWCYRLDPAIEKWLQTKADYIEFQRVPVIFQASWKDLTKAYYTAEVLHDLDKIHGPLFKALHTEELKSVSPEILKTFFVEHGVQAKSFDDTFESFSVDRKLKWSESIAQLFKITRIPSLVVLTHDAGYVSTVAMAGGEEAILSIVDQLAKEAHDKTAKAQGE